MTGKHSDDLLDRALGQLRDDVPSSEAVGAAARRVGAELSRELAAVESGTVPSFEEMIPDYLAGRVNEAQRRLFEEELRSSVMLRHALQTARDLESSATRGTVALPPRSAARRVARPRWLAAAAAVLAAVGVLWFGLDLPSPEQAALARVVSVEGSLYKVLDGGLEPLSEAAWIAGREPVRTAKNSRAVLELDDGSRLEIGERTQLAAVRLRQGTRVRVDRGRIIVEAAEQGDGSLDVVTDDFVVSVKGTIFGVRHGAMGSRVTVVEGEVEVNHAGDTTNLLSGGMLGTRNLSGFAAGDEIAWSQDADRYIEMLQTLSELNDELVPLLAVDPRYSTRLLDLTPAGATVYLALPNASARLAEAYEMVRERVPDSAALQDLWTEVEDSGRDARVAEVLEWLRDLDEFLGDEVAISHGSNDGEAFVAVMAELNDAAAGAALGERIRALAERVHHEGEPLDVEVIEQAETAREGVLSVWMNDDLLVASRHPAALSSVAAVAAGGSNAFVDTPLHELLSDAYRRGAEFVGAADLSQLSERAGPEASEALQRSGFDGARHLLVERRQREDAANLVAELRFDGARRGVASWLAQPGPMGALDFFSPASGMANAFVVRDPARLYDEILSAEPSLADRYDGFEAETGIDLRADLLAALGGEFAFGVDGPLLPEPSWKVVAEVYDADLMQRSIEALARAVERHEHENGARVSVDIAEIALDGIRAFEMKIDWRADNAAAPQRLVVHYGYIGGYWVAVPSRALLERARQTFESGSALVTSADFMRLTPTEGYTDFSAVAFTRISQIFGELLNGVGGAALSDEQRRSIEAIQTRNGPSLYSVFGEADRLKLVMNGPAEFPFLGVSKLAALLGVHDDAVQGDLLEGEGAAEATP